MSKNIFFLVLSLFTISAYSNEYKVSSAEEIKKMLKDIQPGDTITLSNGIWMNQEIIFTAFGKSDYPILLRAETPGKVIMTGYSSLKLAGEYLIVDGLLFKDGAVEKGAVIEFRTSTDKEASYSRVTNCAIVNYNPPDKDIDYKWVSLYGQHNRVDHCYFVNKTNSGCLLVVWLSDKPNFHRIDSNYFAFRPELGYNGGEIIRVGTSHWSMYPSYTTVESNYFEDCNGEREIISNKSYYNVYRNNTFVRCQGTLTLRHGNDCIVEGNFFFGENVLMTGGVRVIGENHKIFNNYFYQLAGEDVFAALPIMNGVSDSPLNRYFQVQNAQIVFNTFIDCKYNLVIGTGADDELSLPPENSVIANNIFFNTEKEVVTLISNPQNFLWEGNIYHQSHVGIESDGFTEIDPKILQSTDGIFRISEQSPAIGSAIGNYNYVQHDIDGQQRKALKDVGCDQYSTEPIIYKPLKSADVGPNWLQEFSETQP